MRPGADHGRIRLGGGADMLLQIEMAALGAMAVIMVAAWAFGLAAKNGGWTDVFWTWGTGLTLAAAALWPTAATGPTARQGLVAGLMLVWMLRLGLYLTPRVAGHPEDARYAAFRKQWGARYPLNMLWVTLPQAPATALLGLSVVLAARREGALDLRDAAAVALFAAAIVGETIADGQMKRFRDDPANKGQVMDRGLWAWSRHPNYFFQWLGWLAYPIIALELSRPVTWLSLTAPAVMYGLLRYVSGVPPLEEAMLKSRGDKFRSYQGRVSVFFPTPPKSASH
jgi:steroid 5-alpha reductase family enzyme